MANLYRGKDNAAFESSQDSEFRPSAPRKYEERLRKTLGRMAALEPSLEASDNWMSLPAAEALAREARLSMAYALCVSSPHKPAITGLFKVPPASAEPRTAAGAEWKRTPSAELAAVEARPQVVRGTSSAPGMPEAGFIPPDFHCQNVRGAPVDLLEWHVPKIAPLPPPFFLRPALERLEDLVPPKPARKKARRPGGYGMHRAVEALAAGLFVAVGLWFGSSAATVLSKRVTLNQVASAGEVAVQAPVSPATRTGVEKRPMGWLRSALSKRAAIELTDTFETGMESWDAPPKTWPEGWSRNPDGYVRPGRLALYRPSAAYSNYRLEFFGQIESKSMGWVIRARDRQNYYAMKFTVVEPGLRPIIAMVHYPVVGGKKGAKVEIPLSVMVHNNTPYHVAVEVNGNRVITSIEGQEVDRWNDETLASGGVGFFSEPGEQARLYWMKLAANYDFLGKVCAYLSGGSEAGPQATVQWRPPDFPADRRQPGPQGAPAGRSEDVVVAAGETKPRDIRNRRIQAWGIPQQQSPPMHRCLSV